MVIEFLVYICVSFSAILFVTIFSLRVALQQNKQRSKTLSVHIRGNIFYQKKSFRFLGGKKIGSALTPGFES